MRWYELRNSGSGWSLYQQGTYAPDSDHRWMAGIAMNANGDIALGYSVSSRSTFPSIRFTGRTSSDPLGQMTVPEQTIIDGTGAQTQTSRWGDYSSMSVDPVDDATFWYTQEYVQTTGSFNWWTRIASFQVQGGGGTPTSVHVESIVTDTQNEGQGNKRGKATVTIFDDLGGPVSGAVVTGTFSGTFNETQTGTTGVDGTVVLLTSGTAKGKVTVSFCVNDVVASLPYNPNDNASPDFACPAARVSPSAPPTAEMTTNLSNAIPDHFDLKQNYPNPFNPSTNISYALPEAAFVKLAIYNTLGEQVMVLVNQQQAAGTYRVKFNASGLPSGVYLYKLEAGNFQAKKKMILTR
ncbi:MAG: T9SS C-terminal target domain-containing protein [Calditrichaeota bacterium]|nr:MAG: T9SS C-terminal target domain-containing protein [Calditrichota bacterium]